ncbi:MerR family DNA-binding transcriptional regulator [Aggregatibacter kilianii]|uniref:MerR family DNA-binding transcriptional regulator n=1 Tax=Aggregatibacter kilianii TaxID=2025884 RepID=UPI000D64AEDB|nr:MerR family transcriptional regulator [Aggregatibacter kilianii]
MKIGEFAKACESSVRMIRFYEKLNLLTPLRNENGYRCYQEQDVGYVKKVIMLNHAGLALKDIALLRTCLNDEPQNFCDVLRGKLQDRLENIQQQIETLNQSDALIRRLLAMEKGK